jgi:hypothetical protein
LNNCLIYCPDSKKIKDGIRALQATLPTAGSATGEDASGVASDLQKENVQFTDSEETQDADQKVDNEYSRPASSSPFHDDKTNSTFEERLQGTLHQENLPKNNDFAQKETIKFEPDTGYMDSPFHSEDVAGKTNVQAAEKAAAPNQYRNSSNIKFRIPFIILTVFGVILLLILGVIITILLIS